MTIRRKTQEGDALSMLRSPASSDPNSQDHPTHVQVSHLDKVYGTPPTEVRALTDIDFTIAQAEFVSIVGPSGCGKSTLMKLIAGIVPYTSGTIAVDGATVSRPITDVGIVFQDATLLDWRRVLGNVLIQAEIRKLPRDQYNKRAKELLRNVGLERFISAYPSELSGGMRQRVSICRALLHDPHLLLMDEPFSALDAMTRDKMNLDLQQIWLRNKKTVLFITHSISDAVFLSDRVLVMSPGPGQIVESIDVDLKRPRELKARETAEFGRYVGHIREIFERNGVL